MLRTKKRTYEVTGGEFGVVIDSLCLKGESTHFSGQANGELKNRYERLRDSLGAQFNQQLNGKEVETAAIYSLPLGVIEKRRLARALRYAQNNQKSIAEDELRHETKSFRKAKLRIPTETELSQLQNAESTRTERFSNMAGHVLLRLGYVNPNYNGHVFGLAGHAA